MALNLGEITPEMMKQLDESKKREDEFFDRHGIDNSDCPRGHANPAHRAWVKFVEREYKLTGSSSAYNSPMARKAFIVGFHAYKAVSE